MEIKELQMIPVDVLEPNEGQVDGLPKNPRFIRNEKFEALVKSIQDAPEMLRMRTLVIYPADASFVVVCGNMRLRACLELGYTELPCYVLPEDTPAEKLREYAIKDNAPFGEWDWDALGNDWDAGEISGWGVDVWQPEEEAPASGSGAAGGNLPPDVTPDELPALTGEDDRPMDRIIVVFPRDRAAAVAQTLVGADKFDKVVYPVDELIPFKS